MVILNCCDNYLPNKTCDRPSGGESCAFDGAFIVLNPITDVAHLIHGPIACCGNSYEGRGSLSSGSRLYRYGFTTDMTEMDIVYGGEEKLRRAIKYISQRYQPAAIFVYSTCIPALIGEDVEEICRGGSVTRPNIPIIPVIAPGFLGHKNIGNRLAGELWAILPLFEKMGIKVQAKITGDSTFWEIASAHHAGLNLLVCGRALVPLMPCRESKGRSPYFMRPRAAPFWARCF